MVMAIRDPVDKNMQRMEARRFASRCEAQVSSIERADTLREVARLATLITLPYSISEDFTARDALRLVQLRAEDRARELIQDQIQNFARAEDDHREKQKRCMPAIRVRLSASAVRCAGRGRPANQGVRVP